MDATLGLAAILRDAAKRPLLRMRSELASQREVFERFGRRLTGMSEGAYLYIVRCRDGSLYIGTTRSSLETRIAQHNAGTFPGYTASRRPVELVYSEWFDRIADAIAAERKLKGWSRLKKEAFIRGDIESLQQLSKRKSHPKQSPPSS